MPVSRAQHRLPSQAEFGRFPSHGGFAHLVCAGVGWNRDPANGQLMEAMVQTDQSKGGERERHRPLNGQKHLELQEIITQAVDSESR